MCNIEKTYQQFLQKNIQNVKIVISNGASNVTVIIKIKYKYNKKNITKKIRDKLVQKQNEYRKKRNRDFKELVRSYVELENRLKALEGKFTVNDSEIN